MRSATVATYIRTPFRDEACPVTRPLGSWRRVSAATGRPLLLDARSGFPDSRTETSFTRVPGHGDTYPDGVRLPLSVFRLRERHATHRGLRPARRSADGRARSPQRLDRLVLLPAVRFRRLLCLAARWAGAWPLAAGSGRRGHAHRAAVLGTHPHPRNAVRNRRGRRSRDRFYAAAWARSRYRPHRRRSPRPRDDALRAGHPVRLRPNRAVDAAGA